MRFVLLSLQSLLLALLATWGALALWFQAPGDPPLRVALAVLWGVLVLAIIVWNWRRRGARPLLVFALMFGFMLLWWTGIQPKQDRHWASDVERTLSGRIEGSMVYLADVRNFDWRSRDDYSVRWENRSYDLDRLRSLDMGLSYWGIPAIAHVMMSFGFDDGRYVSFSVEIRREEGESFSTLGGFFKQFELSLIAAEERDVLGVRTNVRGEDVFLYRLQMPRESMRSLFIEYVDKANGLAREPRWYHTLTANCSTLVFEMVRRLTPGLPLDIRLLLAGLLHQYVYGLGALEPGYTLEQLTEGGRITLRAQQVAPDEDFSAAIRRGMPGAPAP